MREAKSVCLEINDEDPLETEEMLLFTHVPQIRFLARQKSQKSP